MATTPTANLMQSAPYKPSQREIGKLLDLKPRTIYHHFVRLKACGLLDSSLITMPTSLSLQVMLQLKQ